MKLSKAFWHTLREVPADAVIPSHRLMLRAGLIQKSGSGIYTYLPFGLRVFQKVEKIIRDEHNDVGCMEVSMSVVTPGELWRETGRWDDFGSEMLRFQDRAGRDLCISPTNEEAITDCFRKSVTSYKQLPVTLYQIGTKFRDEIRPRYGLMRGREFSMKDAYSFHVDKDCLDRGYQVMYDVYSRIIEKIGLNYLAVQADAGAMASGEAQTHEFQVIADSGEDNVILCEGCGYAANNERAQTGRSSLDFGEISQLEEVPTPNKSTISDVANFLNIPEHQTLKNLVYTSVTGEEEQHVLVVLLGDDEVNEVKLKNFLGSNHLAAATDEAIETLGLVKGFIGPNDVKDLKTLVDSEVDVEKSYVVGAGKVDFHLKGYVFQRDGKNFEQVDLRLSRNGDSCCECGKDVVEKKGIEVGHIFQLGDKYTKSMNATVLNVNGKAIAPVMGCYGIGVTRLAASAIEQNHDENGIIWPKEIAPFHIYLAMMAKKDENKEIGEKIYCDLKKAGFEVLFDDRGLGFGAMMKDAELLGLPLAVVFGERDFVKTGEVEIRVRKNGERCKVALDSLVDHVVKTWKEI